MDVDDELAALRARAYAAGAPGLTASERERLRELEATRRPTALENMARPPDLPTHLPAPTPPPVRSAAGPPPYSAEPPDTPSIERRWIAARVPLLAAVTVALAAAALGGALGALGARISAPGGAGSRTPTAPVGATPLAIADRPVRDLDGSRRRALDLVSWDDPTRVVLLGGADDVVVWWGTTSDGATTCIAVDAGSWGAQQCDDTDAVRAHGLTLEMGVERSQYDASGRATTSPAVIDPTYTVVADPYHDALFVWAR